MLTEVVEVFITTALVCFLGECFPALVGADTPRGEFILQLQARHERMFGGDIIVFKEDRTSVWAIHRAHNDHRRKMLGGAQRTGVTGGCVNVSADVYTRLRDCCSTWKVVIQ